jgi:hypothetical protein
MLGEFMQYEVVEDALHPGDYRVEAIDADGEGEVYTTIFVGPDAETRAEEYAGWKNSARTRSFRRAS